MGFSCYSWGQGFFTSMLWNFSYFYCSNTCFKSTQILILLFKADYTDFMVDMVKTT